MEAVNSVSQYEENPAGVLLEKQSEKMIITALTNGSGERK
jgi:hypothetical protein